MNTNAKRSDLFSRFNFSRVAIALATCLNVSAVYAEQVEETAEVNAQEQAMEEVVVKASRLKGTASAVMQERKNQAFIADILGSEQISRTGDSDAAAALRRITGITLVDGKYIYVRGLGERFSSTQLNGAAVPSPDPTRTVIPLDLFPSSIIESLSVQKSYSASMPAHFAGGNVDVRLKSIPSDFVFNVQGKIGGNSNNFDDGLIYNGGDDDWYGIDDSTRAAPQDLKNLWSSYSSLNDLSQQDNREIAAQMNRDYDPKSASINPNTGLDITLGNRYDFDDFRFGFLTAISYDNKWRVSEEYEGQDFTYSEATNDNPASWSLVRGFDDIQSTEHTVRFSGMLNMGLEYKRDHRIELSSLILHDTLDEIRDKLGNTNNVKMSDGLRVRDSEVIYEERQMIANQIRGTHNFTDFMNLGLDWFYSDSRSNRYAPGNITTRYIIADGSNGQPEDGIFDPVNESSLRKATTASRYSFQDLDDEVENYGYTFSLPLMVSGAEIELKAGGNFVTKSRDAMARRIDVNTLAFDNLDLSGNQMNVILNDDVMLNYPLKGSDNIIRDTSVDGDDYYSGQMIDAYFGQIDMFLAQNWRISAGLRYEDFRQVVAPLDPATGLFDLPAIPTEEDLEKLSFKEDDVFGALTVTYEIDKEMQVRASFSQTTIRPDIREVAPATYIDPLTGFPIGGTPSVTSTAINNYDLRWEWYLDTGENLSVGLFYKDMDKPIEAVQSPAQDGPPLIRIANAEDGFVYGVEMEFLKDFTSLGEFAGVNGADFFLSGNVTLSDSEININTQNVVEQTGVSTTITNPTRAMTGHSPWVVNMNLGWDAPNGNHSATLAYNVFAERIIIPGMDEKDDAFEQPFHSLDFVYSYFPTYSSTLKFKVQNILNQDKEIEFEDTLMRSETRGTAFEVSLKWEF
ncbi:TonB-dependent receptor plug domain-containing protein [Colwellia sp. D2M02]|uniref:TonB-dependent receptor domain-containing protein n=1 Tax=Colwellia sp. D2M02 TaxID=2841562 RepID=UPI001C099CC8|nr:TonB-dependent receptor [Colwellia sp. D2M02]MBU2894737.1 TonB-dependent receptor plug domain-containing protein [Colwellia sp. D2M02]